MTVEAIDPVSTRLTHDVEDQAKRAVIQVNDVLGK